jgi:hypothetical protein
MMQSSRRGNALRVLRTGALFLAMVPIAAAQQSAQVTAPWPAGHPVVTLPNAAPWTTIGLSTNPMRWELRVQDFGTDFPAYPSALVGLGPVSLNQGVRSGLIQAHRMWCTGFSRGTFCRAVRDHPVSIRWRTISPAWRLRWQECRMNLERTI